MVTLLKSYSIYSYFFWGWSLIRWVYPKGNLLRFSYVKVITGPFWIFFISLGLIFTLVFLYFCFSVICTKSDSEAPFFTITLLNGLFFYVSWLFRSCKDWVSVKYQCFCSLPTNSHLIFISRPSPLWKATSLYFITSESLHYIFSCFTFIYFSWLTAESKTIRIIVTYPWLFL